jgi:type I restriction enzyme S subunit
VKLREMLVGVDAGRSLACEPRPARVDEWAVIKVSAMTSGVFRADQAKPLPAAVLPDRRHEIRCGDLLISRANTTAYVGASVLVPAVRSRLLLSDKSLRLRPKPEYDARWLQLMLSSPPIREAISAKASGTKDSMRNIAQRDLLDLDLPDVSLAEQYRIVAVLEDHLSRLGAAQDYLFASDKRSGALLRAAGARLLAAAAPRRPVVDVLDRTVGGVWGADPGEGAVDVDVVRVTELRPRGRLDLRTAARRSVSEKQLHSRQLQDGDLLLEKSGGGPKTPVGRVGLVRDPPQYTIFANFMQLLRPDQSQVRPRYLHLALNALHGSGGTAHLQTASTNIRNIKSSEYVLLPVPVPSLSVQDRLVEQMEEIEGAAQRLQAEALAASRRGTALRRSLLDAAFSGRL